MARLILLLVGCLLAQTFAVPTGNRRPNSRPISRPTRDDKDAQLSISASASIGDSSTTTTTSSYDFGNDDDDDDDFGSMQTPPSSGSNIMSLLNLATALFPSSSGTNFEKIMRQIIREYFSRNPVMLRRQDIADNVIEIDYVNNLTPPFERQESESENGSDSNESEDSNGDDDDNDDDDNGDLSKSKENDNAAEESVEDNKNGNDKASKQDDDDSDYSDEPPGGGDGQGGGVLGLLAGLSGGEDGQSDLGSLLAAVSGIVGSLSGDGFDLNSLIATGFGLFVGLLSEGEENPGSVIASYLLTALDTITGGGSKNNGAFFGNFLSKLIKGTSAVSDESSSNEENGNKMPMADSTGFILSLLMSLSGDMSKGSSGGSSAWR